MGIDLRVEQHPRAALLVPVFGDPMVDVFLRAEVRGKAAAGARRDALPAQHGDMHQREVAADADLALACGPRRMQRSRIVRDDLRQHLLDRTDMRLLDLGTAQGHRIGRGDVLVH
jgi:hypothetical protein